MSSRNEQAPRQRITKEIVGEVEKQLNADHIPRTNNDSVYRVIALAIKDFFKRRPEGIGQYKPEVIDSVLQTMKVTTPINKQPSIRPSWFTGGRKQPKYPTIDDALGGYGTTTYDTPEDDR